MLTMCGFLHVLSLVSPPSYLVRYTDSGLAWVFPHAWLAILAVNHLIHIFARVDMGI
jgi:hypothetical protein